VAKPGRNSPCPCGSGKKYKVCCLAKDEARERERQAPDRAAEKALSWLSQHYADEVNESVENQFCAVLEDAQLEELQELPEELFQMFQINSLEWVLAEGEIEIEEDAEAGLRDVVELLRSYEIGERKRAEREGRKPVDFLFLWESLGLDRSMYPS
jgi:hypothetical protein